jgi:hypothetical protein
MKNIRFILTFTFLSLEILPFANTQKIKLKKLHADLAFLDKKALKRILELCIEVIKESMQIPKMEFTSTD